MRIVIYHVCAEEGEKVISERNMLIWIADRSMGGIRQDDELAADSDDEKKLFKRACAE